MTDESTLLGPVLQELSTTLVGPLPTSLSVSVPTSFTTDKFTEEIRLASTQTRSFNWLVGTFYTYEWSNARDSILGFIPDVKAAGRCRFGI
ncbi:MAG: hypothetical protein WDN69_33340 [Aliidongia sp.]